ncbi:MAG: isopenicillin N synthase family dioxygenase [Leptolyngbyaceae cyanobacterium]
MDDAVDWSGNNRIDIAAQRGIQLIDFAPFLTNDTAGKQEVAAAIYRACHTVGFLYLINHGISQTTINQAFEQSRQFFNLPLIAKQRVAWASELSNRGYIGLERERLDETQPGDLKEAFNLGKEIGIDADAMTSAIALIRWPERPLGFRSILTAFFNRCADTATAIFRAFAIALSMPEDFIAAQHATHDYTLRLLRYPPLTDRPKPGQSRAGAHSDYGSLTLLFQDNVGGLEVLTADGRWMAAPSIPGAILVNTGDLMERWSNDVFRSTQHRVALPERAEKMRDRYSIAFFCQPDAEAEIVCLPTCQSQDNPPKYPPVQSGAYLLSRLQATY